MPPEEPPKEDSARFDAIVQSPARIAQLVTRLLFRERSIGAAIEKPSTLSVSMLTSLAGVRTWRDLLRLDDELERESEGFVPPPLWVAWFEHVHRETVDRLTGELHALRAARTPGATEDDYRGCVYISYAREDQATAERLATQLKDAGLIVWLDRWVTYGRDWQEESRRAIETEAVAFLSLMSVNSEQRTGHFSRERKIAAERSRRSVVPFYIPVRIDDGLPIVAGNEPPGTERLHAVRLEAGALPARLVDNLRRRQLEFRERIERTRPA